MNYHASDAVVYLTLGFAFLLTACWSGGKILNAYEGDKVIDRAGKLVLGLFTVIIELSMISIMVGANKLHSATHHWSVADMMLAPTGMVLIVCSLATMLRRLDWIDKTTPYDVYITTVFAASLRHPLNKNNPFRVVFISVLPLILGIGLMVSTYPA